MGELTLQNALDNYKTIYMPYRNFAKRTRVEYLNDLQDFVVFLERGGINRVEEIGLPIIQRFAAHLEEKGYASLTRKRKIVTIRSFLLFLYQDGFIYTDLSKRIILPFTESTVPHVLTQIECDRIRSACASNPRDRAIIEVLLQTGIKLSELIKLTVNDIEMGVAEGRGESSNGFMRISGSRGKKERIIPLNARVGIALKDYLDVKGNGENSSLFLNKFREPLREIGVQKMLRKYLKRAGIGNASVHTLRHTFGAQHISKGTSRKTIQAIMGLKDARSISVYHSLAQEVVRREMQENSL